MKIQFVIYSLAVTLAGVIGESAYAQSAPPTMEIAARYSGRVRSPESVKRAKLNRLKKDVGLDEQQIQVITPIVDSYVDSMQNVKNDPSLDSRTRRLKLSELRKQFDAEIDARLTPEQQQKLASLKMERRNRLRAGKVSLETSQTAEVPKSSLPSSEVH